MATHKSAEKRARQNITKNLRNLSRKTRIKTSLKKFFETLNNNDKAAAEKALRTVSSFIAKAASKGTMKKETAARKISRLSKKVYAIAAS